MWDRFVVRRKINSFSRRAGWTWAPCRPIFAWIGPTSRCNLRCQTCYLRTTDAQFQDMNDAVYQRVQREVLPGLRGACLTGQGEPFLSPVFYRLLEDTLSAGKFAWVITNGTIIRPDALELLVRSDASVRLSLDGATAETYERNRRGAKFSRAIEFLETVKGIMDRGKHPLFKFEINYIVLRSNLEQMTDCVELAHRYGVSRIFFLAFVVGDRTDAFAAEESVFHCTEEVRRQWERAHARGLQLGIEVPPIVFDKAEQSESEPETGAEAAPAGNGRVRQCPLPWWDTYIDVDGAVRPCCPWPVHDPMGNLNEQSFEAIWNGPKYRELRRRVNTPDMPVPCRHCNLKVRV